MDKCNLTSLSLFSRLSEINDSRHPLLSNNTILGLHYAGNAGFVDSRGFLKQLEIASDGRSAEAGDSHLFPVGLPSRLNHIDGRVGVGLR